MSSRTFFTIGHSNRPWNEFVGLLKAHGISTVADVRMFPGSRKWPQYGREAIERELAKENISYIHIPELGGRRRPSGGEDNAGWENEQFRGYADHMGSGEFRRGVERLLSCNGEVAILCAEAVPWRCHRQLLSDYLVAGGRAVLHITGAGKPAAHKLTPFAKVEHGQISYPGEQPTG